MCEVAELPARLREELPEDQREAGETCSGGEHEAKRLGVPLLGQIPIEMHVRECGDEGHPIALEDAEKSLSSKVFREIAAKLK